MAGLAVGSGVGTVGSKRWKRVVWLLAD